MAGKSIIVFIRGFCVVRPDRRLLALTVASELAGERTDVKGTGTFLPALIDELLHLTPERIVERAKVKIVHP